VEDDMYKGKPVIVQKRPWWRNPIFPWGWYSMTQDNISDKFIMTEGYYKLNDGGGGEFRWSAIKEPDNSGTVFKQEG
jgi:hypothetical protein